MEKVCNVSSCDREVYARDMCKKHYDWFRYHGQLSVRQYHRTIEERFDHYTDRESVPGCWLWTGAKRRGYGVISVGTEQQLAHRLSYEQKHGVTLDPVVIIHHLCHNTACVNPDHLEAVTQSENISESEYCKTLRARIAELEAEVATLRANLVMSEQT